MSDLSQPEDAEPAEPVDDDAVAGELDGVEVADIVLGVIIAIAAFKFIRRAL